MAKKKPIKPIEIKHLCKDCEHQIPNMERVAVNGAPILCGCKFEKYQRFINSDGCETNFKKKICQ